MAFTGPLAVKKRRVRPRITGFQQPKDDDSKTGPDTSKESVAEKATSKAKL